MLTAILQAPAETTRYMVAGYFVIFSIMLLYVISLVVRRRRLVRDLQMLNDLDSQEK